MYVAFNKEKCFITSSKMPPKKLVKPIIISNTKKMLIQQPNRSMFISKLKFNQPMFKEDVIYESDNCDFLKGESQRVRIVNKVNLVNKTCRTIAWCGSKELSVETTSDDVCALIGQKNYDTILSALGSVFNEEIKVRGILALLKAQTTHNNVSTETDKIRKKDQAAQTMESRVDLFVKEKKRKRIRKQKFAPYIVKDNPAQLKKCVINVEDIKKKVRKEETKSDLPDLKSILDEDSNMSVGSVGSLSSLRSAPGVDLLISSQGLLKDIDRQTERSMFKTMNPSFITLGDGTNIIIPIKPEDEFHVATPDILRNVTKEEGLKLIRHQADIDFKLCLQRDDDGYYPLHVAVLQKDVDLVRRQCLALRFRRGSVDLPAGGLTALHMSIRHNAPECALELLRMGADPLHCDAERRTALHLCAESAAAPLRSLLEYIDAHARQILKSNEDLWMSGLESKSDDSLASYLYGRVSEMFDSQGYNPLMAAARRGLARHAALLAARAPRHVDAPAPGCGSTALYRAVAAACLHAKESGNKSTVPENFLKTIEILVEHGADPTVENYSGSSVNTLLTEFNICALSMTIANKMTVVKHGNLASNTMLYKEGDGRIAFKTINGMIEINAIDVNPVCDRRECDFTEITATPGSNPVIVEKVYNASKFISSREACQKNEVKILNSETDKRDTPTGSGDGKVVSLNVTTDKMTGLKVIKADHEIPLDEKVDGRTDRLVIVENVKLKREYPKVVIAGSAVKRVGCALKSPIKGTKLKRDNVYNIPQSSLVKIVPLITDNDVSNIKKRK